MSIFDSLSAPANCECQKCTTAKNLRLVNGGRLRDLQIKMILCPVCGNKRCPHASDHALACTGSNEPGQPGSAYPALPAQEVMPSRSILNFDIHAMAKPKTAEDLQALMQEATQELKNIHEGFGRIATEIEPNSAPVFVSSDTLAVDWKFETDNPLAELDAIAAEYEKSKGRTPDAEMAAAVKKTKEMLFTWWAWHREKIRIAVEAQQQKDPAAPEPPVVPAWGLFRPESQLVPVALGYASHKWQCPDRKWLQSKPTTNFCGEQEQGEPYLSTCPFKSVGIKREECAKCGMVFIYP